MGGRIPAGVKVYMEFEHFLHVSVSFLLVFPFPPMSQRCARDTNWCVYLVSVWVSMGVGSGKGILYRIGSCLVF